MPAIKLDNENIDGHLTPLHKRIISILWLWFQPEP